MTQASVRRLLRRNATAHVSNLLAKLRPAAISSVLAELSHKERTQVFELLVKRDRALAAQTLNQLGPELGESILESLSPEEIADVLSQLESNDAAAFVDALPEEISGKVLQFMSGQESHRVEEVLRYEADTAGRIMTPNVFALHESLTVGEAIAELQRHPKLEVVFYLYVIDDRNHLVGVVSLRQLLLVPPTAMLKRIMTADVISVTTAADQEDVAREVALYDLLAIPVVNEENKLVGVVTVDDVVDIIKEEATEDILHLVGVEGDDHVFTPARQSVKKRLPWLLINLVTAAAGASVVAWFEPTIRQFSYLAIFLPVVAGLGGNAGTQTLTVIVRGLALGELTWGNSARVLYKEVLVGIAKGVVCGVLAGVGAYLWKGNFLLGLVLGLAMVINMLVAGASGTLIPLALTRLKVDPAISSGVFVTTMTDVVGFLSFLGLASLLFGRFLVSR